eukprot:c39128_g1_i1 orf=1-183(-)
MSLTPVCLCNGALNKMSPNNVQNFILIHEKAPSQGSNWLISGWKSTPTHGCWLVGSHCTKG